MWPCSFRLVSVVVVLRLSVGGASLDLSSKDKAAKFHRTRCPRRAILMSSSLRVFLAKITRVCSARSHRIHQTKSDSRSIGVSVRRELSLCDLRFLYTPTEACYPTEAKFAHKLVQPNPLKKRNWLRCFTFRALVLGLLVAVNWGCADSENAPPALLAKPKLVVVSHPDGPQTLALVIKANKPVEVAIDAVPLEANASSQAARRENKDVELDQSRSGESGEMVPTVNRAEKIGVANSTGVAETSDQSRIESKRGLFLDVHHIPLLMRSSAQISAALSSQQLTVTLSDAQGLSATYQTGLDLEDAPASKNDLSKMSSDAFPLVEWKSRREDAHLTLVSFYRYKDVRGPLGQMLPVIDHDFGLVVAYDSSGERVWHYQTDYSITGIFAATAASLYFAGRDGFVEVSLLGEILGQRRGDRQRRLLASELVVAPANVNSKANEKLIEADVLLPFQKNIPGGDSYFVSTEMRVHSRHLGSERIQNEQLPKELPALVSTLTGTKDVHIADVTRSASADPIESADSSTPTPSNDLGIGKERPLESMLVGNELISLNAQERVTGRINLFTDFDFRRKTYYSDLTMGRGYYPYSLKLFGPVPWTKITGIDYLAKHDSLIVSLAHQDAVVGFDRRSGKVQWIFGNPNGFQKPLSELVLRSTGGEHVGIKKSDELASKTATNTDYAHLPAGVVALSDSSWLVLDAGGYGAVPPDPPQPLSANPFRLIKVRTNTELLTYRVEATYVLPRVPRTEEQQWLAQRLLKLMPDVSNDSFLLIADMGRTLHRILVSGAQEQGGSDASPASIVAEKWLQIPSVPKDPFSADELSWRYGMRYAYRMPKPANEAQHLLATRVEELLEADLDRPEQPVFAANDVARPSIDINLAQPDLVVTGRWQLQVGDAATHTIQELIASQKNNLVTAELDGEPVTAVVRGNTFNMTMRFGFGESSSKLKFRGVISSDENLMLGRLTIIERKQIVDILPWEARKG